MREAKIHTLDTRVGLSNRECETFLYNDSYRKSTEINRFRLINGTVNPIKVTLCIWTNLINLKNYEPKKLKIFPKM